MRLSQGPERGTGCPSLPSSALRTGTPSHRQLGSQPANPFYSSVSTQLNAAVTGVCRATPRF